MAHSKVNTSLLRKSHYLALALSFCFLLGGATQAHDEIKITSKAYHDDHHKDPYTEAIKDIKLQALHAGHKLFQLRESVDHHSNINVSMSEITNVNVQLSDIKEDVTEHGLVVTAMVHIFSIDYNEMLRSEEIKKRLLTIQESQRRQLEIADIKFRLNNDKKKLIELARKTNSDINPNHPLLKKINQKIHSLDLELQKLNRINSRL